MLPAPEDLVESILPSNLWTTIALAVAGSLAWGTTAFTFIRRLRNFARTFRQFRATSQARADQAVAQASALEDRINASRGTLAESAALVQELQTELDHRSEALERLTKEIEESKRLARMHADEAAAVRSALKSIIDSANSDITRHDRRLQWLFFLAGAVLAVPLGVLGNVIFTLLTR